MKIVGHRGASHLAEDNTLESIQIALDYGVDYVEVDLQPTNDKNFLVFHDASFKTSSGKKITIKHCSTIELKEIFRHQLKREALFFEDVADFINNKSPKTGLVLDCKQTVWSAALLEQFEKLQLRGIHKNNFIVISFSFIGLFVFRKRENSVKTFYLRRRWIPLIHLFLTKLGGFTGAGYYIPNSRIILPLKAVKKLGLQLFLYNINDVALAEKCQKIGIEYIETDEPNIIVPAIRST